MTRRKKMLLIVAGSLVGLVCILAVTSILVLRSQWFRGYVRTKIVSVVEDDTGGKVDLKSFNFDWRHLQARIDGFVLHGTEPPGSAPLFAAKSIELHLKLFSGWMKAIDLQYLGVDRPSADIIVFPNGKTNIPTPKVARKPSNSGLETVVDLAIGKFEITNGSVQFLQQKITFSGRGENLRAQLMYNPTAPGYQGQVSMNPLKLVSGNRPPLNASIVLPVVLEKDAVRINSARIQTPESQMTLNGTLANLKSPEITAQLQAHIGLAEISRSVNVPIYPQTKGSPKVLDLDASVRSDRNTVDIQNARVNLGKSELYASGKLKDASGQTSAAIHGNLSLDELGKLLHLSAQPSGTVQIAGNAKLTGSSGYLLNGNIDARDVSLLEGTTRLHGIRLVSAVQADPHTVSINGIELSALGGELDATARIENFAKFQAKGSLHDFDLRNLAKTFAAKPIGYAGIISGTLAAQGDLKAKGTTGINAQARIAITPARGGTPLSGHINADYNGARNIVALKDSRIVLPSSRIELSGEFGRQAQIQLTSRNLNDFLPAMALASKPPQQFPVALNGGTASVEATVSGPLASARIASHVSLTNFSVEKRRFNSLTADLNASPSGASVENGSLTRGSLQAHFAGSVGMNHWSADPSEPLVLNATVRNGDLADVLALAGQSSIRATGALNADAHIAGTVGSPRGAAQFTVANGSAYDEPFDRLQASVNFSDQLVNLSSVELAAGPARLDLHGTFTHPRDSFQTGHVQLYLASNDVQLAQFKTLQKQRPGMAGLIHANADASGDLRQEAGKATFALAAVNADLTARGVRDKSQTYGDLTASARTAGSNVNFRADSNFAGSAIQVSGQTQLTPGYPTTADASIHGLPIERVLAVAGKEDIPARGDLSADAHVNGTLDNPNANLRLDLTKAVVYDEPVDSLQGNVSYTNRLVTVSSMRLATPAGQITLSGSLAHSPNDFNDGHVDLQLTSSRVDLSHVKNVQKIKPGLAGTLQLAANASVDLRMDKGQRKVLLSKLNANGGLTGMKWNNRALGDATLEAATNGNLLSFKLDSDFAKSAIHGSGNARLQGDYPLDAKVTFTNVTYSGIESVLGSQPETRPGIDGLVEGQVTVTGPAMQPDNLQGTLQLSRLELSAAPRGEPGSPRVLELQNQGPVIVDLNRSVIRVQSAKLAGHSTEIDLSGSADLKNKSPLNLTLKGNTDLAILQDFNRDIYSGGNVALDITAHGSFAQPRVNGRIELKKASINLASLPNGLSNANGVILLNGTSASIQTLTAESGGGTIALTGFAGFTGATFSYNLHANAKEVRTRYQGASVVSSADIKLTGTSEHSLLAGNVTIQRIGYNQQSDFGSILSQSAAPAKTPTAPTGPVAGMRLDVRIRTASDVKFQTSLARQLQGEADLHLRGTLANPGMTGRVVVTSGTLVFFGNQYNVNRGNVAFYDPLNIEPILDVSLETMAQGVDVILGVTGPIDNLKLTYRSDPPLEFQQIVALLATGRTPADPTIAANQPAPPQQGLAQMGESAIVGQAIANPIANRLQRVFGVNQISISPTFVTGSSIPQARFTLQQQITPTITFSYTTDLTETNSQIVRIEWALTPRFSAVATRDENGIFGIDFYYKKHFR